MTREPFVMAGKTILPGKSAIVDIPVSVLSDHTPMSMAAHVLHGKQPGPTVFVSGAIHGDEIIGVEIVRRLIRTPQLKQLKGTLICVPIVNGYGFINHSRYLPDRRDLNRSFPGATKGSLAARLAKIFMTEIVSRCDVGIDLHSAAQHRVNLPQIRIDGGSKRAMELAQSFAPPVIILSKLRDGSLRQAARDLGKDVLVYECGEALRFDETALRIGVTGVLRVLRKLGMLNQDKRMRTPLQPDVSKSSEWMRATMGGVLRAYKTIGAWVEEGEVVAGLSDPLGQQETEVKSPATGLIIGRTMLPIVNEGDALFHIAEVVKPITEDGHTELEQAFEGHPLFDEDEIL
ncbi:succinylglutamate desuccinylase/aspartoacylase family protein [Hyphobacterium sp.]|uniref:succinylglutamate desuccinylase/aspartoacylase family protein n=1 Tax=Hyphobacterium sp. TaxID=2004662 RepID=UPI003B51EDF8